MSDSVGCVPSDPHDGRHLVPIYHTDGEVGHIRTVGKPGEESRLVFDLFLELSRIDEEIYAVFSNGTFIQISISSGMRDRIKCYALTIMFGTENKVAI